MPNKMQEISKTHLRITCECGRFIHEIRKGEDGKVEYNAFLVAGAADPGNAPKPPKPKKKGIASFFEDEEEETE